MKKNLKVNNIYFVSWEKVSSIIDKVLKTKKLKKVSEFLLTQFNNYLEVVNLKTLNKLDLMLLKKYYEYKQIEEKVIDHFEKFWKKIEIEIESLELDYDVDNVVYKRIIGYREYRKPNWINKGDNEVHIGIDFFSNKKIKIWIGFHYEPKISSIGFRRITKINKKLLKEMQKFNLFLMDDKYKPYEYIDFEKKWKMQNKRIIIGFAPTNIEKIPDIFEYIKNKLIILDDLIESYNLAKK